MKKRKNYIVFASLGSFLMLGACGAPDAPPPPPLPMMVSSKAQLSVDDVVTLQNIQSQAIFMQALGALAATHSESDVIHAYALDFSKAYKAQQDSAEKIAKDAQLILDKKIGAREQIILDGFKKIYKKKFDRDFLNLLVRPMLKGFVKQLNDVQKNTKEDALKVLSKKQADTYEQYRQQGCDIKRSQY